MEGSTANAAVERGVWLCCLSNCLKLGGLGCDGIYSEMPFFTFLIRIYCGTLFRLKNNLKAFLPSVL